MDGPRAARIEELPLVEELANTVFRGEGYPKTMFQEFPDLYSEENIENIRVIAVDGKPVANINYLPSKVSIFSSTINIAMLGGVGTLPEYRGRGYATLLLKDCIDNMYKKGTDVLSVSGSRRLYWDAGCLHTGVVYYYTVKEDTEIKRGNFTGEEFTVEEFRDEAFDELVRLYRAESVRYIRPYNLFRIMLKSKKFDYIKDTVKKTLLIRKNGLLKAYVLVAGVRGETASICDSAGPGEIIISCLKRIMKAYGFDGIRGYVMPYQEDLISFCRDNGIALEKKKFPSTIKIINFESFMNNLRQYFREVFDNGFVNELSFRNEGRGGSFIYKDGIFTVPDGGKLNNLIFGGEELSDADYVCNTRYDEFMEFFKAVFPIPFVYTGNLNYV